MILLLVVAMVLVSWVLLSALAIVSYRVFLMVWDDYGFWPAMAVLAIKITFCALLLAW